MGGILLFAACQKEFSFETGSPSAGSLKDTTGNCLPVTVNGSYYVDSTLADSNFVMVQVRFSAPGTYTISTDTSNGLSFSATGSVKDVGVQTIKLTGIGKPIASQLTDFSVTFDTSVCTFQIPVTTGTNNSGETAIYTLAGAPSNCSNADVQGDYEEGVALNSTNVVSIQVNVDSVGTYFISTVASNGMTFSGQGAFTSTGVQAVVLQGSGTPINAGNTDVPLNGGGNSCNFTVPVKSATPPGEDSAWQFSDGLNFYHGFIDSAFTHIVPQLNNATALSFYGFSYPGPDSLFQLDILLPGGTTQTGTYNTDSANADFYLYSSDTTKAPYFKADYTVTPAVNIQINIKTYDPVTKIITGTFSGTAVNAAGQKVTVNEGKIYAKVE